MLTSQVATASWARSLRRANGRISTQRLASQRLPRTAYFHSSCRSLIDSSSADRSPATPIDQQFSFSDMHLLSETAPQTLTEKIVQAHAVGLPEGKVVRSGDYVQIQPHRCMTHDNTAAVLNKYRSLGATRVKDPKQLMFAIDHDVQNKTASNLAKYDKIAAFAEEQGVEHFPAGYGIGHQVMVSFTYTHSDT